MKKDNINTQSHYKPVQLYFPAGICIDFQKHIDKDDICQTVMDVTERMNIYKYLSKPPKRCEYSDLAMMRIILLAYALCGDPSTRKIADMCRYDVRFMYVSNFAAPSHETINRFIWRLKCGVHAMFTDFMKLIEDDVSVAVKTLSIDGTKLEAYANKYTFIWKKGLKKRYEKLWKKISGTIERLNRLFRREKIDVRYSILREPSPVYLKVIIQKIREYAHSLRIEFVKGKGRRKTELQKIHDLLNDYFYKLMEYTIQFDMLADKNSCSKTDCDALMMHMKYDYYNHTNVFKPGYNIQFGISSGFITEVLVNAEANDTSSYIPLVKRFHDDYGFYPSVTVGDAGYGSYDNYMFNAENGIEQYLRYPGMQAEKKRTTEKNKYRKYKMRQKDGSYVCPEGYRFEKVSERTEKRGLYDRLIVTLENSHCSQCSSKSKCTKAKGNRKLSVSPELEKFQEKVRNNIKKKSGQQLMDARRIFNEGSFGICKEDYKVDRLRRRYKDNVETEVTLVAIGFNLRKYRKALDEKAKKGSI